VTDYEVLFQRLGETPLSRWLETLPSDLARVWAERPHGDLPRWRAVLEGLPSVAADWAILDSARVAAGHRQPLDDTIKERLTDLLQRLHPWRKGPYDIHGIVIDTEWRSDWKWDRLAGEIAPLGGRRVLDVGCGNGYHCWRMAGAGADLVIGVDPTQLFVMQFYAIRHFLAPALDRSPTVFVLPLALEQLPPSLEGFDTAFSMGVLYHRRSPLAHLEALRDCLRPGGELVLETLVTEGADSDLLIPRGRYARMRNVWQLPSAPTLADWLEGVGFERVRCVDVSVTTRSEQRSTDWMRFESLAEALDPVDPSRTVEGLPAPRRGVFIATRSVAPQRMRADSACPRP